MSFKVNFDDGTAMKVSFGYRTGGKMGLENIDVSKSVETICWATYFGLPNTKLTKESVAKRNLVDKFSKGTGRRVSLNKSLLKLNNFVSKDKRRKVWNEYFNRFKDGKEIDHDANKTEKV